MSSIDPDNAPCQHCGGKMERSVVGDGYIHWKCINCDEPELLEYYCDMSDESWEWFKNYCRGDEEEEDSATSVTTSGDGQAASYGHIAYEAYCEQSGWKSLISGADLPKYNDLSSAIRIAWWAAAKAVLEKRKG